jgi:hypothetical protein
MENIKYVVNVESGEISEVEMTELELEQEAKEQAARKKLADLKAVKENEKEAQRQAILDRLGLTADEAKLILG